jgi:hypothetical protein
MTFTAAFRSKTEQNAQQEKNDISGDDDEGVIAGINLHGRQASPSSIEGEVSKENEPPSSH